MEFKNSISIITVKFGTVFRVILYIAIVGVIVLGIAMIGINPIISDIENSQAIKDGIRSVTEDVRSFLAGDYTMKQTLDATKDDASEILSLIKTETNAFTKIGLLTVLLLAISRFLIGLCYVPLGDIFGQYMQSGMRYGFFSNYVKNIKQSLNFSWGYTLFSTLLDVPVVLITVVSVYFAFSVFKIISLMLAVVFIVAIVAFRFTLTAGVIPYILFENCGSNFFVALKRSLPCVKKNINGYMRCFIMSVLLFYLLNAACAVTTVFVITILSLAALVILVRLLELCFYFKYKKMKYYIDDNTVVDTAPFAERADLVEIED